jgi:hypothetical protein
VDPARWSTDGCGTGQTGGVGEPDIGSTIATNMWSLTARGLARLFSRGDSKREAAEASAIEAAGAAVAAGEQRTEVLAGRWQGRLEALLADHPELRPELESLIAQIRAGANHAVRPRTPRVTPSRLCSTKAFRRTLSASVMADPEAGSHQFVEATGNSQVAGQHHGVQNNYFGGYPDRPAATNVAPLAYILFSGMPRVSTPASIAASQPTSRQ